MDCQEKRVLIVEDSFDIQALLNQLFVSEGYKVSRAYNGKEALTILQQEKVQPCMILLDIMMPVMDGHEFREQQAADLTLSKIPVVVMTADKDIESHAKKIGAKYFLTKPVNIKKLLEIASEYCPPRLQSGT